MSLIANLAINLDARSANQQLQQFQQQSTAAGRAAEQLQAGTATAGQAAQGAGRQFQTAANGLKYYIDAAGRARRENGQLVTSTEAAAAGLRDQARAGNEAGRSMSKLEGIMKQLGIAAGAAGIARFAGGLTRTAATFEGELRKAAAIEGGGNFDQLRQDVERVAAAAAGTPTQVAALATSLSRAGFTAAETGQSLQGIVRGAEATAVTFEQMGSITSDVLRGFGIETAKTESVVDILVKTANSSNQGILDLGEAMSYAAPGAKALGVDINDLSATIGLLANAGIRGSRAGTTLSTGLNRLQLAASGSQEALFEITRGSAMLTNAMNTLGSEVLDSQGKLKPLDEVLVAMKRNLDQLNVGQRVEITKALFGEEAGRGFQVLLSNSEEKIRAMFGTIRDSAGTAAATQKEMQGFSYSMEVLGGNVEIVSNAIGDKFIAVLKPAVDLLNDLISASQKLPQPVRDAAAALAAAGLAAGSLTLSLKAVIPLIRTAATALGFQGLAGAATAAQGAMAALLPLLGKIAAIGVITIGLKFAIEGADEFLTGQMGAAQADRLARDMAERRGLTYTPSQAVQRRFAAASAYTSRFAGARDEAFRRAQMITGAAPAGGATTGTGAGAVRTGGGGGGGAKKPTGKSDAEREAERAAEQERQIQERLKGLSLETQALQQLGILRDAQLDAELTGNKELQNQLALEERIFDIRQGLARELLGESDERVRIAMQTKAEQQAAQAVVAAMADTMKQEAERKKALEDITRGLQDQIDLTGPLTDEQRRALEFEKQIAQWKRDGVVKTEEEIDALRKLNNELEKRQKFTTQQTITAGLNETKKQLDELTNVGNIVVKSANAIGDAFGQAFRSIASGAASTKEVLAEFFQNVANAFLDMAAQIIAKQVVMITLQAILKALGGAGGEGGNMAAVDKYASTSSPETMTDVPILAKGGVFSPQGHVERYAQGGVVTAPTMFRFAKGSGFAPGLMGEAGPEAILPLQRTPSGDLGVRATLQVPYASKGNKDLQVPYTRAGEQYGTMTGDGMIRFESTVINNQEFVTKDEAERIGQAAASRGAEIAQRRMKNSPQVRRSLGIA